MKMRIFIFNFLLLLFVINGKNLRHLKEILISSESPSMQNPYIVGSINNYVYSNHKALSTNQNIFFKSLNSKIAGQSIIYITEKGKILAYTNITKEGDVSNINLSEFYGINAAILVQGGELIINFGIIKIFSEIGSAVFSTNKGKISITGAIISSFGEQYSKGLQASFGSLISGLDLTLSTIGDYSPALYVGQGKGIIKCSKCTLSTLGKNSPLIYSLGEIIIEKTKGKSLSSQMVTIEGNNNVSIKDHSSLECNAYSSSENDDTSGVKLFQPISRNDEKGIANFYCFDSSLKISSGSAVYGSAPMFLIKNTKVKIILNNCSFNYGSDIFISTKGAFLKRNSILNGSEIYLILINQEIKGDLDIGNNSSLELMMINSTLIGKINSRKTASKLTINLDSKSHIILNGNSYYTSLNNTDVTDSNIEIGNYLFKQYNESKNGNDYIDTNKFVTLGNLISFCFFSSSGNTEDKIIEAIIELIIFICCASYIIYKCPRNNQNNI